MEHRTKSAPATAAPMDPYRYLPFTSRKIMQAWADRERPPAIAAWTPITKPLSDCRVALLTTAGISTCDDFPFDQEGERDDPWWGDPSWRRLPFHLTEDDVDIAHLHIDHAPVEADLDVVLPLRRLAELAERGVVGEVAAHHYSIMGYVLDAGELVEDSAPQIAAELAADEVDLVLMVPV